MQEAFVTFLHVTILANPDQIVAVVRASPRDRRNMIHVPFDDHRIAVGTDATILGLEFKHGFYGHRNTTQSGAPIVCFGR
jgi:hypothetical protein